MSVAPLAPLCAVRLMIYSVDTDGHDDGGAEVPEHKTATDHGSYDITFIVER